MVADILGEYPQVYGYFYLSGSQVIPSGVYTQIIFDTTVDDINVSNTSGDIFTLNWGLYLVETVIQYTTTADGFHTYLTLDVNNTPYKLSYAEAQAEASLGHNRLSIETQVYIPPSVGVITLKVFIDTSAPAGITVGGASPLINNCIRVSRLR